MKSLFAVLALLGLVKADTPLRFAKAGPHIGVCASIDNAHPLAMKKLDLDRISGDWVTVFLDTSVNDNNSECSTTSFKKSVDGSKSLIMSVKELTRMLPVEFELPQGVGAAPDAQPE